MNQYFLNMSSTFVRAAFIVVLTAVIYGFTLEGDFVFDDSEAILKNPDVTSSGPLTELFEHDFWGSNITSNYSHKSYRPLTILTYRLNFYFNESTLDASQYKLTNLLCHIVSSLLVWRTYHILVQDTGRWTDPGFLAALLFAAHPVHVEAVSGAVGRADLLAAIFYFLAFICYVMATQVRRPAAKRYCYMMLTVMLAALSMLSKEIGVTILGVCLSYEITYVRRLDLIQHFKTIIFHQKKNVTEKPPKFQHIAWQKESNVRLVVLVVSSMLLLMFRWAVMGNSKPYFQPMDNPAAFSDDLMTRILTYQYIYFLNILLLLWPQWLCFDWSMGCVPLVETVLDPRVLCVLVLHLYIVLSLCFLSSQSVPFKKKRLLIMSYTMTAVPFLPASNIFFTVGFVIAERLLYIPSAGFCLLIALGLTKLAQNSRGQHSQLFYTLYCLLLASFSLKSCQRALDWETEYNLFTSGLEVCPANAKVHYNVAKAADARHQTDRAIDEYTEAIRLYPKYYQAMNNLANLLKDRTKFTKAEYYLREAIKYKPDFPAAWMNLAIVLANTKRLGESHEAYLTALSHRHNYPDCYFNLGNLYLDMKLEERAEDAWNQAISLNPRHKLAWSNLLALLDNTGQTQRALDLIPTALSELADSHTIHFIVGNILGKVGHLDQAEKHFIKTIQLAGTKVQAIHYSNLGVLYHRWKRYVMAETMYSKALEINPTFKSAKDNIQMVKKLIKKQNQKIKS